MSWCFVVVCVTSIYNTAFLCSGADKMIHLIPHDHSTPSVTYISFRNCRRSFVGTKSPSLAWTVDICRLFIKGLFQLVHNSHHWRFTISLGASYNPWEVMLRPSGLNLKLYIFIECNCPFTYVAFPLGFPLRFAKTI
jgi:hypothetical protein